SSTTLGSATSEIDTELSQRIMQLSRSLETAELRARMAEEALKAARAGRELPQTVVSETVEAPTSSIDLSAQVAQEEARRRIVELTAQVEKERAIREEAVASAERVRAIAELSARQMREKVEELSKEIVRGLKEIGIDTRSVDGDSMIDRLKYYVQNVRIAADARVARAQFQAEARLNDVRTRTESEVAKIMHDAQKEVDRAKTQSEEEIRRIKESADSKVVERVAAEREQLAAEALARRMALAEQLRASIEADAQIRFIEEKARIEATYEADRVRMQRQYEDQLHKFESEYQRRLEAAQLEAKRASDQLEALTKNDTSLLMRSEAYQKIVRENAMLREDLASSRNRLEQLGREKEDLVREMDSLRREFANVQARLGTLESESKRYQGIAVLAEPLQKGVNINSASLDELQVLPGIGVQEARNIVWYRENVGPFRDLDELSKVPGITATRAQALKGLIRIR
ncbi:TPA: hypothetical protein DEF17_08115, partial [bacterium]|nr:hypothetical protein [bacterium]